MEDTAPYKTEFQRRSISSNALSSMLAARENLNVVEVTRDNALRVGYVLYRISVIYWLL